MPCTYLILLNINHELYIYIILIIQCCSIIVHNVPPGHNHDTLLLLTLNKNEKARETMHIVITSWIIMWLKFTTKVFNKLLLKNNFPERGYCRLSWSFGKEWRSDCSGCKPTALICQSSMWMEELKMCVLKSTSTTSTWISESCSSWFLQEFNVKNRWADSYLGINISSVHWLIHMWTIPHCLTGYVQKENTFNRNPSF